HFKLNEDFECRVGTCRASQTIFAVRKPNAPCYPMRFLAHLNKTKWRARFALVIGTASNISGLMGRDNVAHCRCQRGMKEYRTRIALCDPADGSLRFDQELQFDVTLYADKAVTEFDSKLYTIAIVNESDTARAPLQIQVDLASMLRPDQTPCSIVERSRILELSTAKVPTIVTLNDPVSTRNITIFESFFASLRNCFIELPIVHYSSLYIVFKAF
ncbi:hypothetical protein BVRB_025630, partial [Beta vulgaris subsp. vulgaris]